MVVCLCAAFSLLSASCGKSKSPIVVGSGIGTDQLVVAEIVAQHIQNRLHRDVRRRSGIGGEQLVYQALETGEITIAPEYTGSIETAILRETPSSDPSIVLARVRGEMLRVGQLELLDPLGYDNPPAMVVLTADAERANAKTLSQAAAGTFRWKIALSYEFQQRMDSLPALNSYKLPLEQAQQGMEAAKLFPALQHGDVTMISSSLSDGHLLSPGFTVLADDRHAFAPYQACLLVREDALAEDPQLRTVLHELSGKFNNALIRKLDAEVELGHKQPADVAAQFLSEAGLK
ncbi:MAG TPA: glycine betaine ABC transporter substrate-binding protein [Bryobacteraceae bacterium]|nr:glycine betaine ABC transporter substrate-binding protein [Bryobacteraceae bacterium]